MYVYKIGTGLHWALKQVKMTPLMPVELHLLIAQTQNTISMSYYVPYWFPFSFILNSYTRGWPSNSIIVIFISFLWHNFQAPYYYWTQQLIVPKLLLILLIIVSHYSRNQCCSSFPTQIPLPQTKLKTYLQVPVSHLPIRLLLLAITLLLCTFLHFFY